MAKRVLKGILWVVAVLLLLVLGVLVAANIYYPRYVSEARPFDAASIQRAPGEVVVMSYNIRCWAIQDWAKKSWPYRASLVMDVIAENAPDIIITI